jgi:RNA polymerase sigma-32 factor
MATLGNDPEDEILEPEVLGPSDEELSNAPPVMELSPAPDPDHSTPTDTTAVVPVTALQQYLAEIRRYPYLSKEEELRLFQEYHAHGSREAAVKLIMANLRVSVAIASEYLHTGADHMDLIQEGNVGLMQAIKKFDPAKNVRFYAYAAWWSRAYILRYLLNTFRLVKIGTTQDQRKLFYNLKKEKAKLESLDQPIGENQDGSLLDIIPSQQKPADEQLADEQLRTLFRAKLAEFIRTLDERDEDILRNRILSEDPLTLDDLGGKYGITKERTRQLEARIIKRLRDYIKKDIKDFDRLRA